MNILVTGSAGFIGFHLARRLLHEGHRVTGLDAFIPYYDPRLKEARHRLLEAMPGFRGHVADMADAAALEAVLAETQAEVVVHLAAQAGVRYALEQPASYLHNNVQATFNLLEGLRRHPARHLLIASTSSAYGVGPEMPFRETAAAATPLNMYSASKLATEHMAHAYAHLWRQPVTAFRFFTVYGPWGRPDMAFFKFTDAILRGRPIDIYNHGRMERDFTYIDDLVEAILRLIPRVPEAGRPVAACDSLSPVAPYRLVNIGNSRPVPLLDFIAAIERATGRRAERNLLPLQPGDVPATWADTALLHALTGFRPATDVDAGIAAFVAWFRDYYGL
ncbi:SDR family NAD(P)-dependent oxidoreductase [Crenalkalicoccus roseus]|uniref:SDR family NAD(P)-dependent oxidoreductase n=1 Tax=Crenalkalicoccus roseus TaxID=1485588 RepID=UPI001081DED3|nr:SDR family NAD(P)-dependent oxidoreductase [Crenalkalicoccus roseus]